MTHPTLRDSARGGVNSDAMSDETPSTVIHEDVTEIETAIVMSYPPTDAEELAWSDEDALADVPTAIVVHHRAHSLTRWVIALIAILASGLTAIWFGIVLYRDEAATVTKPSIAVPVPTVPKVVPPPPTAAPPTPDPPHAPAKYPWVSVTVSEPMNAAQKRAVSYAYGTTADAALRQALQECREISKRDCKEAATIADGCVVAALGNGTYEGGGGPDRSTALASTKANFPWADNFYTFCAWDGNGS